MALKFRSVSSFQKNIVSVVILLHQSAYIASRNLFYIVCDLIDRIGVDLPAKLHLGFHLVTFGYSHISHIVGYTDHTDMAAFHDANRSSHPGTDFRLNRFVIPETDDDLSLDAHSRHHMTELPVAVSGLVLIHKIHIDRVVRDFLIKLGM